MDGHVGEHALAAGELVDTEGGPQLWRRVGDRATAQSDDAAARRAEAADDAQQCRLAGAVGAEKCEGLALLDLEAHVEQDLHRAVVEVEVVDLEGRNLAGFLQTTLLVLLVEQFLDVEGQVVAHEAGTAVQDPAAQHRRGHRQHEGRDPRSPGVGEEQGDESAAGGADEEDVEGDEGGAAATQSVGDDGLHQRADHGEGGDEEHRLGDAEGDEQGDVRHGVLDGLEEGAEADADADHLERACGVLPPEPVELGTHVEEAEHGEDAADGDRDAAVKRIQVPALLEIETLEDGDREEAESECAEADDDGLDGADLHEP